MPMDRGAWQTVSPWGSQRARRNLVTKQQQQDVWEDAGVWTQGSDCFDTRLSCLGPVSCVFLTVSSPSSGPARGVTAVWWPLDGR